MVNRFAGIDSFHPAIQDFTVPVWRLGLFEISMEAAPQCFHCYPFLGRREIGNLFADVWHELRVARVGLAGRRNMKRDSGDETRQPLAETHTKTGGPGGDAGLMDG